jgi:hypothetical protein
MRPLPLLSITLTALLLPCSAFAQERSARELLAAAEFAYPSAKVPALFSPESPTSAYAAEPEDPYWSPEMEARILEAIEQERARGLVVRRTDVECRSSTCAVLLVHAISNRSEGSVQGLIDTLRQDLGFVGVTTAEAEIPLQFVEEGEAADGVVRRVVKTTFVSGYVELVLSGAPRG